MSKIILYKYFQRLVWLASRLGFFIFTDLKISGRERVRNVKGPLLILANHKSMLDPGLVGICFPFLSPLHPLRFIAHDNFFTTALKRFFFEATGCYPAKRGQGLEVSLSKPMEVLKAGGTVVIFPEGRRHQGESVAPARRGIGVLIQRVPEVNILPIAIFYDQKVTFWSFIFSRIKIRVQAGEPFKIFQKADFIERSDSQLLSQKMMREVEVLYSDLPR